MRIFLPQQVVAITRDIIGINSIQTPGQTVSLPNVKYTYELCDHLGNVRATVTNTPTNVFSVESLREYYPQGSLMPDRGMESSPQYRYDYQGQLKDQETGENDFYFRQYDPALARWSTTDPYEQSDSPYLSMGNAHTVMADPDGGWANPFDLFDGEGGGGVQGDKLPTVTLAPYTMLWERFDVPLMESRKALPIPYANPPGFFGNLDIRYGPKDLGYLLGH